MRPLDLEAGRLAIVGHILLTMNGVLITDQERTVVSVSLSIVRCCCQTPGALGIDLTDQLQVHFVADGEIITAITQIETTISLITIGRHDQTAGVALRKGEEAIRHCERQGHISHHEIGRTEDHIFTWTHLCTRECQIKVWMRIVTGRITSMLEEHLAVGTTLGYLTGKETLILLGIDRCDQTFLRLEVKGHCVALILIVTHLENGRTCQLHIGAVHRSSSMHQVAVEAHRDTVALQIHILVLHLRRTIEVCHLDTRIIRQRVVSRILHRRVDTILTTTVDAIKLQRVIYSLVVLIDSQFKGVHHRGVAFRLCIGFNTFGEQGVCLLARNGVSHIVLSGPFRIERQGYFCHHHHNGKKHKD